MVICCMELNKNAIGKVAYYNQEKGVGRIITNEHTFMFILDDLLDKDVNRGDLVKFRAEKVNNEYRAFFISKYDMNKFNDSKNNKSKIYKN